MDSAFLQKRKAGAVNIVIYIVGKVFPEYIAVNREKSLHDLLIFQSMEMRGSGKHVLQIVFEKLGRYPMSL